MVETMDAKRARRPGPKPRGPFEGKRQTLTTRITDATRSKLEAASRDADRSLSQEIEFRLEQSFREIDVRHRETLLARRSAIEGWNSLVSVPIDQLNAYYSGGIKPAELADFIVKALGFTAIAVGVSK